MHSHRFNPNVRLIGIIGALVAATLTAGAAAATFGGGDATAPTTSTVPPAVGEIVEDVDASSVTPQPVSETDEGEAGTPEPSGDDAPADEIDEGVDGDPGVAGPGEHGNDWTDGAAPAAPEPGELDPATPEIDPCDQIADPDQDFVIPTVVELAPADFAGQLPILNCTSGLLDVELSATNGMDFVADAVTLPPGISEIDFSIDDDAVGVGAFDLKFKVTQTGCCADYGDVIGFKQGFNPDFALDLDLTAGEGQGGCKAGCIRTVWVEGNPLHTSVTLNVETNVAADIEVRVATQAPVPNQADILSMPGVAPVLSTNGAATTLSGPIGDLDATTTYHVLVTATDDNGTSTFTDTFTTVDPVDHPDGFAGNDPNPGCSTGCITHAVIDEVTHDTAHLTMATSMQATMEAFLVTTEIDQSGPVPTIFDPAYIFHTGDGWTSWSLDMAALKADTTYNVLLRATDANGKRDYQVGSFTTAQAPERRVTISVDRIDLKENGDHIGRGEVRFGFTYDGELIGTRGEQKLKEGATVRPDAYNFVVVDLGPEESTAKFAVYAGERDVPGIARFCEAPVVGLECLGINWNSAFSSSVTLADIEWLPLCSDYGFTGDAANDHCEAISHSGGIGDVPTFDAIIRYQLG